VFLGRRWVQQGGSSCVPEWLYSRMPLILRLQLVAFICVHLRFVHEFIRGNKVAGDSTGCRGCFLVRVVSGQKVTVIVVTS
jgi:hypothetical protein